MATTRSRFFGLMLGFLPVAAAVVGVAAGGGSADARTAKVLGARSTPRPECPRNTNRHPCTLTGSVTGFQHIGGGRKGLMRAREDGRIVAWGIRLSRPNKEQRDYFGDFFEDQRYGTAPYAQIAVLGKRKKQRFRLLRSSPAVALNGALGLAQTFTLNRPLRIRRGQFLGITIPTWAPAFATNLPRRKNAWRASRKPNACVGDANIRNGKPHRAAGTNRRYGCSYSGERLLYWGLYSPD